MGRARRRLGFRTDGYNIFRIITRFLGIIEKMNFNDGDMVRKGDLLFEIEDDEYVANVAAIF